MHRSFVHKLFGLAGLCGLLALFVVPVSSATRRDTQGWNCQTVGGGTICRSFEVEVVGPKEDPNIVCGSGSGAFHIFDQWVDNQTRTVWLDENGNVTKYTDHDVYSFGQWSNPVTGEVVPYTERSVETIVWAVPGDDSTATQTFTGENIYRLPTGGQFVLQAVGRQVFNSDGDLLSSHGPNAFIDGLVEGDPHAFDEVCAALGAT
jgi:hypothetical protein